MLKKGLFGISRDLIDRRIIVKTNLQTKCDKVVWPKGQHLPILDYVRFCCVNET